MAWHRFCGNSPKPGYIRPARGMGGEGRERLHGFHWEFAAEHGRCLAGTVETARRRHKRASLCRKPNVGG